MASPSSNRDYVLGHSESEVQRLIHQADLYRPLTMRVLQEAGIQSGMRVLDLGCGGGDVSFLIAELVGGSGAVVGVDRAKEAVDTARKRAQELGVSNVRFVQSAFDALDFPDSFDAVAGRLILHHQVDPVFTVRQAALQVRQGGLVIFHELDFSLRGSNSWPISPLCERCVSLTALALERCGLQLDIGKRLHQTFKAAGLPAPEMRLERAIGAQCVPAMAAIVTAIVRTLLPKIEEFGLATARELQVESLTQRLEAELIATDAVAISLPLVGAWARKP